MDVGSNPAGAICTISVTAACLPSKQTDRVRFPDGAFCGIGVEAAFVVANDKGWEHYPDIAFLFNDFINIPTNGNITATGNFAATIVE